MFVKLLEIVVNCKLLLSRDTFAKKKIHVASCCKHIVSQDRQGYFMVFHSCSCFASYFTPAKSLPKVQGDFQCARAGRSCHQQPDTRKCADATSLGSPN